jgi:hypothetical protein
MSVIGELASITRYPVKSMSGETVRRSFLTDSGLAGDRLYAFESSGAPPGMLRVTSRERREMLRYKPCLSADGKVEILCPNGEVLPVDSTAILTYLQRQAQHGNTFRLTHTLTPQTDVRPLSLISPQTIHQLSEEIGLQLDPRRFRTNLCLDLPDGPFAEEKLIGQTLRIGSIATIRIRERVPRCRFITYDPESPHTTDPLFSLMKHLDRGHQGRAGVYASVLVPGPIEIGDPIQNIG